METFLWSPLPLNELISLQPDSSPPKCSNFKSGNSAKMRFEIVIIAERIHENCCFAFLLSQKMPVYKHFRPRNAKCSQFTSYSLTDVAQLAKFAKKYGKVVKRRSDGLIVVVARKQKDVGFYVKGGKKYYTRYFTAIWSNFGQKLETLHPGFPTQSKP